MQTAQSQMLTIWNHSANTWTLMHSSSKMQMSCFAYSLCWAALTQGLSVHLFSLIKHMLTPALLQYLHLSCNQSANLRAAQINLYYTVSLQNVFTPEPDDLLLKGWSVSLQHQSLLAPLNALKAASIRNFLTQTETLGEVGGLTGTMHATVFMQTQYFGSIQVSEMCPKY